MDNRLFAALILAGGLAACAAPADSSTPAAATPAAATAAPSAAPPTATVARQLPAPEAGKAVVGGRILSRSTNGPLVYVRVAIAEAIRSGDELIYFDDPAETPAIEADEQGHFVINSIAPGDYVIVVGDPIGRYTLATEADGRKPLFVTLSAGEQRDFGELIIDLEP